MMALQTAWCTGKQQHGAVHCGVRPGGGGSTAGGAAGNWRGCDVLCPKHACWQGSNVGLLSTVASARPAPTFRSYLVHVRQNARQGNASTLTRREVSGGGRKPYKQKGSGNARRGSRRSPLMPGGGISFGPKPRDWSTNMNKKERKLALATALQSAACDMLVCDDFSVLDTVKTQALVAGLAAMGVDAQVGAADGRAYRRVGWQAGR